MIEVVAHDPRWADRFEALRAEYAAVLAAHRVPVVAIEHVGSTAVPGLAAKPVIDCDVVVAEEHVEAAVAALASIGLEPRGDLGVPQRYAFEAPARLGATHTYVVVDGSLALRNHLGVREVLRADPALRERYATIKRELARGATSIDDYVSGKSDVLQDVLLAAGLGEEERAAIDAINRR